MEVKHCLSFLFLMVLSTMTDAAISCNSIKEANLYAASGTYRVTTNSGQQIRVYCEMGLNGGGYTFLSPESLPWLTDTELSNMFTNRTAFLLRVRKTDGSQPYAVLQQLSEYSSIPLKFAVSEWTGYNSPVNANILGSPLLYFGFLPTANATNNNIQGIQVNGFRNTFTNCDKNPNSHFTLYPNFGEIPPSTYNASGTFCDQLFSKMLPNPSGRVMPSDMFFFGETHWGGCGCYVQSNQVSGILSFAIGFK